MSTGNDRVDHADRQLGANAKRAFDASVDRLDGATRSRLARARAAAMAAAEAPAHRRWLRAGAPRLAALAAAAAIAVAVVWLPEDGSQAPEALTAFDDLDILLDEEELDLFEELEFYAWLDAQAALEEDAVDADGSG